MWRDKRGDLPPVVTGGRSQSLHSTASGREPIELRAGCHGQARKAKPCRGKGGRKVDAEKTAGARSMTSMNETAPVPARATQADSMPAQWSWVVRTVWTERMLAALGNGVKGNKRFSRCWPPASLRHFGTLHHDRRSNVSESITMLQPLTGEPCAGEPHARFGGRGGRESFSTPIGISGKTVAYISDL